ncbi:MAG TPA: extracellular solute-binding protein, partial [Acidimicrobiales bacterium]|nr:extracellular solute-binding protein [Acidimicrobiales bacterium]
SFNSSQADVAVSAVIQPGYDATLTAYTQALSGGSLPDLVQMDTVYLQLMIDSQSVVPAQSAIDADHFDLSDFLPSTTAYFKVDGQLWALPWNISTQILYFDQTAFRIAGLDPVQPPATFDAVRSACTQITSRHAAKYGATLKLTSSNFEDWIAMGGGQLFDHDNGRSARASSAEFGGALGTSIVEWFSGMLHDKLADASPSSGLAQYDNLIGIGTGTAPMTLDTSAALGTIDELMGLYPKVKLGVGPIFGPPGPGGVPLGGAGLYMVNHSPAERQDGAWQFMKFLLEPDNLATWAAGTGYLPIRSSSVSAPATQQTWAKYPGYKVAYDQLAGTHASVATAGGVSGAMTTIETGLADMLTAISNGTDPRAALSTAVTAADSALSSYNARVG